MLSITNLYYNKDIIEENIIKDFISDKFETIKKKVLGLKKTIPDQLKSIEKKLRNHNIDVDKIKKYALKESRTIHLKNGKLSNFQEKINLFVKNLYSRKFSSNDTIDTTSKIAVSIVLLAVVAFINAAFLNLLINHGVKKEVASAITAIFCAPIVEETSKMFSIQYNATGWFFFIFNVAEFTTYFVRLFSMGLSVSAIIALRILPTIMHYVTTMIQVDTQKNNEKYSGLALGVLIHTIWNTLVSLKIFL